MDSKRTKFHRINSSEEQGLPLEPIYSDNTSYSNPSVTYEPAQVYGSDNKRAPQVEYTYVQSPTSHEHRKKGYRQDSGERMKRISRLSLTGNPVSDFKIPTFAAPWQHDPVDDAWGQPNPLHTVRVFNPRSQSRRLLANGLLQWLITVFLIVAMGATLFGFSKPVWISKATKYTFNALITLLSLALGLALVRALSSYAKLLSWRFLASQYWNLQDFELVMNCDSQTKVLKLLRAGRTPGKLLNKTQLLCIASLTLVIGLQIVIGMLGLTYSVDTAPGQVQWMKGNVSVVDLSNICLSTDTCDTSSLDSAYIEQTAAANTFGTEGLTFWIYYDENPGSGDGGSQSVYQLPTNNQSYFYQFIDQSAGQGQSTYGTSQRYIITNASCANLEITEGGFSENTTLGWVDEAGESWTLDVDDVSSLTTTFIGNGSVELYCGERCTRLLVLNTGYADSNSADNATVLPQLFGCNSTVGQVINANSCPNATLCSLADDLARILAGSVGWSGQFYGNDPHSLQFKNYPLGSPYSWYTYSDDYETDQDLWNAQHDPTLVANNVAQYAAEAIGSMDSEGPRIYMISSSPVPASALSVEWNYAIPILLVIPVVQLIVLFLVNIWANGAVIKDDSYIATARLLRPVVEKLDRYGSILTGDEVAKALRNFKIIYGVRAPVGRNNGSYDPEMKDADWHLGIIAENEGFGETPEEGWNPGKQFPVGKYD